MPQPTSSRLLREAAALFDVLDHQRYTSQHALDRLARLRTRARARWYRRAGYPGIANDLMRGIPAPPIHPEHTEEPTMTVSELIRLLEQHPADAEVRIATQPSWPFEHAIAGVVASDDAGEQDDDSGAPVYPSLALPVVYIAEGAQLGYLPCPAHFIWH